jgi:hypothetical protein
VVREGPVTVTDAALLMGFLTVVGVFILMIRNGK